MKKDEQDRFWGHVAKRKNGCWEWTADLRTNGYGRFYVKAGTGYLRGGGTYLTHRLAWEISNSPIPSGLCVLHRCDNRKCVNPEHLFLGTQRDNIHDCMKKGRFRGGQGGRKLMQQEVLEIRRRCAAGELQKALAAEFCVTGGTISQIVNGLTWKFS